MIYRARNPPIAEFVARGFPERGCFPHRSVVVRKQYPDTYLLLEGRGVPQSELLAGRFFQINLYTEQLSEFPDELFTNRSVNWHNQQLGKRGLIAAAGLFAQEHSLTITVLQSDLCQQLYRHPRLKSACKTQVDNRFGEWHRMLFNAILDFAIESGLSDVYCPTAAWILGATKRGVQPQLFQRIYDLPSRDYECERVTQYSGEYWKVAVADNANRVVRLQPEPPYRTRESRPMICVFHDTEENVDTDISPLACRESLSAMLAMEKDQQVKATYNILGTLFHAKRDEIWKSCEQHALAFHSFNHDLADESQLKKCREIDLQVRGYRPPRSVMTQELTDYRLSLLNFEWLASGKRGLGATCPVIQNGIAKIPILTDDYPLVTNQMNYQEWERRLLEAARERSFLAFGLHDCYAGAWLEFYPKLLEQLASIGDLVTADEVCDRVFWQS